MIICQSIKALLAARKSLDGTVAFVPTMGALHEGHLTLMRRGVKEADHVIVSIFVNPTQFGPDEDFDAYPRILDEDAALCATVGVAIVFAPEVHHMYPDGASTTVTVAGMTDFLCGPHRPDHFDGVTTVVSKLFNIVRPDVAIFGQKDYQQLAIIRKMTRDLLCPIQIIGQPTVRENDGLAMSSRNRYLDATARTRATDLSKALCLAWSAWQSGERTSDKLKASALALFARDDVKIDYIELVDPNTLQPHPQFMDTQGAVLALAIWVGQARLIDNLRLDGPLPPTLTQHLPS